MKSIKLLSIGTLIIVILAYGLTSEDEYSEYYGSEEAYYPAYAEEGGEYVPATPVANNPQTTTQRTNNANKRGSQIKMHPLVDTKTGQVNAQVPLPANWTIEATAWRSPNGAYIQVHEGGSSLHTGQVFQSIDQVIQQALTPVLRNSGFQIGQMVDLPEVARNDQAMYAQYWKYGSSREHHQSKGLNVTDSNGKPGFVILHFMLSQSQFGNFSYYNYHILHSSSQTFEQDKQQAIYALANLQLNPQVVAAHNQREQQRAGASDAAFQRRMAANQASFNASQRTAATYSEISDISHQGYMNRSRMNDQGHQNSINSGIWERQGGTNPYSGQQVYMEGGYNNYYMNQNNEYIGTNDAFYNPQQDPNVNNQDWQQVNPNGGGY